MAAAYRGGGIRGGAGASTPREEWKPTPKLSLAYLVGWRWRKRIAPGEINYIFASFRYQTNAQRAREALAEKFDPVQTENAQQAGPYSRRARY